MSEHTRENWRTTVFGVLAALADGYRNGLFDDPTPDKVAAAVFIAALGYFAKG